MSSALDIFTKFVNSPGGVLTAGAVLAGIVWKFFERVEAVLMENTKFEIAVWLVGIKAADRVPWPDTFARMFDRVFGQKHFSWTCFLRSALVSIALGSGILLWLVTSDKDAIEWFPILAVSFIGNVIPDYFSLLATRLILRIARKGLPGRRRLSRLLFLDAFVTLAIAITPIALFFFVELAHSMRSFREESRWTMLEESNLELLRNPSEFHYPASEAPLASARRTIADVSEYQRLRRTGRSDLMNPIYWDYVMEYTDADFGWEPSYLLVTGVPGMMTLIWLWLYAGSGFIIKAARRFDLGFDWFNRHFDIEKKPLQSIGLVAGAIVALVYWTAVGISRVL